MPRRSSNRNRIDRMREEAAATHSEKARKESMAGRVKLVWAVKDGHGTIITTYPYPQKDDAEAEAARLRDENRRHYLVTKHTVPLDS